MVKNLHLILIILFTIACNEETPSGSELNETELSNLRQVSANKCRSENADKLKTFRDNSNKVFTNVERGYQWKREFKEGATVLSKNEQFAVWKVTATNVYYIITLNDPSDTPTTSYRFLKINKTTNTEASNDLLEKFCTKGLTTYSNFSFDSGSAIVSFLTKTTVADSKEERETKTYTYASSYPALFGLYQSKRSIETFNADNVRTAGPTETSQTLTYVGTSTLPSENYGYYTGVGAVQYCIPTAIAGTTVTFPIPASENCAPTPSEFDPATELINP